MAATKDKPVDDKSTEDKPTEVKPVEDKKTYLVLTPLKHSGTSYAEDDDIELSDQDAAPLLAVKAIGSKPPKEEVENG